MTLLAVNRMAISLSSYTDDIIMVLLRVNHCIHPVIQPSDCSVNYLLLNAFPSSIIA